MHNNLFVDRSSSSIHTYLGKLFSPLDHTIVLIQYLIHRKRTSIVQASRIEKKIKSISYLLYKKEFRILFIAIHFDELPAVSHYGP